MPGSKAGSLSRKVQASVAVALVVASVIFLVVFTVLYRAQIEDERRQAVARLNELMQATLENAMVKRDIDGLQTIVMGLGALDDIVDVMILAPDGEIRFASNPALLGQPLAKAPPGAGIHPVIALNGRKALRSVNPVSNKPVCTQCHGPIEDNPVNGILIVDYDAEAIDGKAVSTALTLGGAGVVVLGVVLGLLGWLVRRHVLAPVGRLDAAVGAMEAGDLSVRVAENGDDEITRLGKGFNSMAASLQASHQALAAHDAFLQGVIDGIPDGVRVIDRSFGVVLANQAFCAQAGLSMDEVIGRPCYASGHDRDEPCPQTLVICPAAELFSVPAGQARTLKCVHQHRRADGSIYFAEITSARMLVPGNDGVSRDLLVEAIRDMSADIQVSHGQRLSEIAELATGVAHEVRNPMVAVRLTLEGILRKGGLREGDVREPAELGRYLEVMLAQVEDCIAVSDRLLNLAHLPTGEAVSVDVGKALEDASALLRYEAHIDGITVTLSLPETATAVLATPAEIRMLALNLMQNAFHAMPGGGTLAVTAAVSDGVVKISFRDSGVGIPPESMPQIFDPFYSVRADGVEGTGMGLAICREICRSHGGDIQASSVPGQGSVFTVTFPAL